jgi:hypothetical protein
MLRSGIDATHNRVDMPCVQSVRSSRRVGPAGQITFDLVAEVTQRRVISNGQKTVDYFGGSTIILGPNGEVRYVISKSIQNDERANAQLGFVDSRVGSRFWQGSGDCLLPKADMCRLLHE